MGYRIKVIHPDEAPEAFPDPANTGTALGQPEGLVAIGGDLSPQRLVYAYEHGIFPWYNDDQPILWWSPDPRAIIRVNDFHMSRSLVRELKNNDWSYTVNQSFSAVINGCASNRGEYGTWITSEMTAAYTKLHKQGYAHSIESWLDGQLAGGIYGICLGNVFFGESMFSSATSGSKVAISALMYMARKLDIQLLDCQISNPHLETLGMTEISRQDFLQELTGNKMNKLNPGDFGKNPAPGTDLCELRQKKTNHRPRNC